MPSLDFMPKMEKPGAMAGEVELGRGLDWVGVGRAYVTVSRKLKELFGILPDKLPHSCKCSDLCVIEILFYDLRKQLLLTVFRTFKCFF